MALDALFGFLLDKPNHRLYQHNVNILVDSALTTVSPSTSLQQAVVQPMVELVATVRARCRSGSADERALVARIEEEYVGRVLMELAATLDEHSSRPLQARTIDAGVVCGHTVTLRITPVIRVSDSDAEGKEGEGKRAGEVGPWNARVIVQPQVNEAAQDVRIGHMDGGFQTVDEREIASAQGNGAAQGMMFGRVDGLSQGSNTAQHTAPELGMPASHTPQAPPRTFVVRDDAIGLNHSEYIALDGTLLSSRPTKRSILSRHVPMSNHHGLQSIPLSLRQRKPEAHTKTTEPLTYTSGSSEMDHTIVQEDDVDQGFASTFNSTHHAMQDDSMDIDDATLQSATAHPGRSDIVIIPDHTDSVDRCHCLRNASAVEYPELHYPDQHLAMVPCDGNKTLAECSKTAGQQAFETLEIAGGSYQGFKRCANGRLLPMFKNVKYVAEMEGREVTVKDGSSFKLMRFNYDYHTTFVCADIPFGSEGVSRSQMLHALLHSFPAQPYLHARIAGTPTDEPSAWTGTMVVT